MARTKQLDKKCRDKKKGQPAGGGSSHKGQKLQQWKLAKMDQALALWDSNPDREAQGLKPLSIRQISKIVGIGKTTVNERIMERRKGRGHIAGGRQQAQVLTEGESGTIKRATSKPLVWLEQATNKTFSEQEGGLADIV